MNVDAPQIAKRALKHGRSQDQKGILEKPDGTLLLDDGIDPLFDQPGERHPHQIGGDERDDSEYK